MRGPGALLSWYLTFVSFNVFLWKVRPSRISKSKPANLALKLNVFVFQIYSLLITGTYLHQFIPHVLPNPNALMYTVQVLNGKQDRPAISRPNGQAREPYTFTEPKWAFHEELHALFRLCVASLALSIGFWIALQVWGVRHYPELKAQLRDPETQDTPTDGDARRPSLGKKASRWAYSFLIYGPPLATLLALAFTVACCCYQHPSLPHPSSSSSSSLVSIDMLLATAKCLAEALFSIPLILLFAAIAFFLPSWWLIAAYACWTFWASYIPATANTGSSQRIMQRFGATAVYRGTLLVVLSALTYCMGYVFWPGVEHLMLEVVPRAYFPGIGRSDPANGDPSQMLHFWVGFLVLCFNIRVLAKMALENLERGGMIHEAGDGEDDVVISDEMKARLKV